MKTHRKTNSVAVALLLGVGWLSHAGQARAQYVVTDPLNTVQASITAGSHVMSYAEQVTQYAKQVQQYETQLQQYQTQIQNLQALGQYKWADASTSLNQLVGTVNGTTGAYNSFLSQFQTQTQWNQHPPTVASFRQSTAGASATEIASYGATVQNLSTQNANMAHDAAVLSKMTASAQDTTGQLQALQAGMQLASAQVHQLQELRALLVHLADNDHGAERQFGEYGSCSSCCHAKRFAGERRWLHPDSHRHFDAIASYNLDMKFRQSLVFCLFTSSVLALSSCDDSKKKEEQAREERTKRSVQGDAGAYTPAPIDMSMGTPSPTPVTPKP